MGTKTGISLKLMALFDDGKVRVLSASVTAAPSLLSSWAIRRLFRLLRCGLLCAACFALFAEEAVPEIANQRFFLLKLLLETRFTFARPLMLSFPIMTFPLSRVSSFCVIATRLSAGTTGETSLVGGKGREAHNEEGIVCSMPPLYTNKSDVSRCFFIYFQRTGLAEYLQSKLHK